MSTVYGLLLAYHEERHDRICKKMPQLPSTGQLDSHLSTKLTQHGHPMPFHTWGLDLVGPVNPPSRGYIWILVDECDGDPLRCLSPKEAKWMIKEVHLGECGEYQGKKKLYICLL